MGMFKLCVLICVASVTVGDKPPGPTGIQPHHITGQGGYDGFGQSHAPLPVYDSKGKGYAAPAAPAPSYGAPQDEIPVVYYPIRRPKPEKEKPSLYKAFESKMKEYSDKFTKFVKGATGYDYDYAPDYYGPPVQSYGPPADSYGPPPDAYAPPADSYGPPADTYGPPADTYGPPADTYGPPVEYEYVYEEEKDKGFGDKMKEYYDKFVKDMYSWQEKSAKKIKEMFGYGDYDYEEVVEYAPPAPAYGAPPAAEYGAPAPAPTYGAPAPTYHEPAVVYQPISRPKEPKPEKGFFSKAPKAPKRRPIKKPVGGPVYAPQQPAYVAPQPTYHAPVQPTYHAPQQPTYVAPKAAPAPTYAAPSSEYGAPKPHDITHVKAAPAHIKAAPVKAKGGHAHHKAPAQSVGVSSYTSH